MVFCAFAFILNNCFSSATHTFYEFWTFNFGYGIPSFQLGRTPIVQSFAFFLCDFSFDWNPIEYLRNEVKTEIINLKHRLIPLIFNFDLVVFCPKFTSNWCAVGDMWCLKMFEYWNLPVLSLIRTCLACLTFFWVNSELHSWRLEWWSTLWSGHILFRYFYWWDPAKCFTMICLCKSGGFLEMWANTFTSF